MAASKPCHNCRRSRLRCDRSVPGCLKCTSAGKECLGYGKFYKWVDGVASQDQTRDLSVRPPSRARVCFKSQTDVAESSWSSEKVESLSLPSNISLLDPLLQGLDSSSRYYLHYYAVRFCQDLIIYDSPQRGANPFRDLIPMSQMYPFLRDIIIAASALHYSNAVRRWSLQWQESPRAAVDALVDALRARQRAITSVQSVIGRRKIRDGIETDNGEKDALLAAVLFFLNFALIDSGKDGWRSHMNFVGRLLSVQTLESPERWKSLTPNSQLDSESPFELSTFESIVSLPFICPFTSSRSVSIRDYIISDSTAYYIWSNALDSLLSPTAGTPSASSTLDEDDTKILDILLRTEANSYHSCPSRLLYIVFRTSRLARDIKSNEPGILNDQQLRSGRELLKEILGFDGDAWAAEVCVKLATTVGYVDDKELEYRKHIAATFRAAVCLFVLLVAPGIPSRVSAGVTGVDLPALPSTADLATTIFYHLSFIPTDSPLFKFATWPIFLAGVETADPSRRTWVLDRLRDMRDLCPWGMLTSTMETLVEIWQMRDNTQGALTRESAADHGVANNSWLLQLQGFKIDCLIV